MVAILLLALQGNLLFGTAEAASSMQLQLHSIPTQYTQYLDTVWTGEGWKSSVPSHSYAEGTKVSIHNLRMQMTFAFAYLHRSDPSSREKMEIALRDVLITRRAKEANWIRRNETQLSTRSFHDAIGLYLGLRILEAHPNLLTTEERALALRNTQAMLPWVLRAPDTENRALLGAAYGTLILRHPLLSFSEDERTRYEQLIRTKVTIALRNVDKAGVYREGTPTAFSLHYHLVTTVMLAIVGQELHEPAYTTTARRMAQYVHNRYPLGQLTWRGSGRPTGIGLQTVLLRATTERYLGATTWERYWLKESANRGFIDRTHSNRLVWRDDKDKTLNDDYSFMNMAAIVQLLRPLPTTTK